MNIVAKSIYYGAYVPRTIRKHLSVYVPKLIQECFTWNILGTQRGLILPMRLRRALQRATCPHETSST